MPLFNGWLLRALFVRLRRPEMRMQRRYLALTVLLLVLFLAWAVWYLVQQPTTGDQERAALVVFAAAGGLGAMLMALAVWVRWRTRARWTLEEALRDAGLNSQAAGEVMEQR